MENGKIEHNDVMGLSGGGCCDQSLGYVYSIETKGMAGQATPANDMVTMGFEDGQTFCIDTDPSGGGSLTAVQYMVSFPDQPSLMAMLQDERANKADFTCRYMAANNECYQGGTATINTTTVPHTIVMDKV